MNKNFKPQMIPYHIANLIVEDILDATDQEIMQEAISEYGKNVDKEVEKMKKLIEKSINRYKKDQLIEARRKYEEESNKSKNKVVSLTFERKKQILDEAYKMDNGLTLAARKGNATSEKDVDSMIDDLIELGVLDKDGNLL